MLIRSAPIALLAGYLFLIRWPHGTNATTGDYCAVVACTLLGIVPLLMTNRPASGAMRILAAGGYVVLTGLVFLSWRWLSQPLLNDIF